MKSVLEYYVSWLAGCVYFIVQAADTKTEITKNRYNMLFMSSAFLFLSILPQLPKKSGNSN
jgi:hypothetical protein